MRAFLAGAVLLGGFVLGGCGYVGDPLPPALKIPMAVSDLTVSQVGPVLKVRYTLPKITMEDLDIERLGAVEILVSPNWPEAGETLKLAPDSTEAAIPVAPWAGREVTVGVRTANAKLRYSPWSNLVRVRVEPEIATPSEVAAVATAAGVELTWKAVAQPGVEWKVYRLGTVGNVADKDPVEIARVRETRFTDPGTEYGGRYRYTVAGVLGEAVSEASAAATIVPEDRFAPAAPQGLTALAGATAVQLSWERGTEPDIAFYRVYQAAPDGEWRLIAPRLETATYSHASAANRPPSQLLRYAVTAVDRNNNESEKSQTVEVPLP